MAAYRFLAARLVWHHTDSDVLQNHQMSPSYTGFDIACFLAHRATHEPTLCDWTSNQDHDPLVQYDHTYPLRSAEEGRKEDTREAALRLVNGFAKRTNHSVVAGEAVHSSTGGSGGGWTSAAMVVAFPLRIDGALKKQHFDGKWYTLHLEMDGGTSFSAAASPAVFEVAVAPPKFAHQESDTARWLVRLARTRSQIDRVELHPIVAGDQRPPIPLAPHGEQSTAWVSGASAARDREADAAEVRVYFQGEPAALLSVERVSDTELQERSGTWDPAAELLRRKKEIATRPKDWRDLAFFLDFDVQFHAHFVDAWRPLNAQELAHPKAPWPEWRRGRMELLGNHAPSIFYARLESVYADEHRARLQDCADLYGDDLGNVGPHTYRAHLDSLAQSQESVLRQHYAAQGGAALDYGALHRAFQHFAAGDYRTNLKDMAFRNGEPDSSFMFFWAEFAGEVVRWLGTGGSRDLTAARESLWARLEEILLDAVAVYARHYRPAGKPGWKDYSWQSFDPGVRPSPLKPGQTADFARWRDIVVDAFS